MNDPISLSGDTHPAHIFTRPSDLRQSCPRCSGRELMAIPFADKPMCLDERRPLTNVIVSKWHCTDCGLVFEQADEGR